MVKGRLRIEGDLNTEKGFEKNDDAVVFVLNPEADDPMQIRFLLSPSRPNEALVLIGPDHQLQKDVALRAQATEPR